MKVVIDDTSHGNREASLPTGLALYSVSTAFCGVIGALTMAVYWAKENTPNKCYRCSLARHHVSYLRKENIPQSRYWTTVNRKDSLNAGELDALFSLAVLLGLTSR
jgi:hypothetical protein